MNFQDRCLLLVCAQALMTMATLMLYIAFKCRPRDYEELCTLLGASFLWFITVPLSLMHWQHNRQWDKSVKEHKKRWEEQ